MKHGELLAQKATSPLTLHVRSDAQRTLQARVTVTLQGLGVERDLQIAPFDIAPGQKVDIDREPAAFPIKPTGTSMTALARVDYDGPLGPVQMPAGDLRMAFTPDQQRVFVSSQDDTAVRLGSLGHKVAAGRGATVEDRQALFQAHLRFDGELDGVQVHEAADRTTGGSIADVLELPVYDALESPGGPAQRAVCLTQTNAPVCVSWDPTNFRDVGVAGGGVAPEDYFQSNFAASYAWARLIADGSEVWQGRLSATGCTPAIWRCTRGPEGEACGDANLVRLGPTLQWVGPGTYDYVLGTGHTSQDVYVIGHELGHSAQRSNSGGPRPPNYYYYEDIGAGKCGREHVMSGKRVHCLQSSHGHIGAEGEGFGHFYAARLLNNQGFSTCRFTYYKSVLVVGNPNTTLAPPLPINCNVPYSYGASTGWERTWCHASERSTEYDWMTFLWSVNGSAPTSERTSLNALFSILGHPTFRDAPSDPDFTWTNIQAQAQAQLSLDQASRFVSAGASNGMSP